MPTVLWCKSMPRGLFTIDHLSHCPARTQCSDSVIRLAVAINKAKPKSAVVSVKTSGVFVANTPAAVIAGTSKLLYPTEILATIFRPLACIKAFASILSLPATKAPTTPESSFCNSSGLKIRSSWLDLTSKDSSNLANASGKMALATKILGFCWLTRLLGCVFIVGTLPQLNRPFRLKNRLFQLKLRFYN